LKKSLVVMIPLAAALTACGGGGGDAPKNKAAEKASALQPGQYEVTSEVTNFRASDDGPPKINTPQGTSATRSVCVADGAAPPPNLVADEGFDCQDSSPPIFRGGTLSVSLTCRRPGLQGDVGYTVNGSFQADSFEAERQLVSRFPGMGDVIIASTVRGRRTGECSAATAGNAQGNATKK